MPLPASWLQSWHWSLRASHLYGLPGRPSPFLAFWTLSSPESGAEKTHSKPIEAAIPADFAPGYGQCNDSGRNGSHPDKTGVALDQSPTHQTGKPSVLSVVQLVLSLCALVATSLAAILWNPIDADFINRADNAGWDETMLLPHQMELSLVVNASVLATFVPVVTEFFGVLASRRRAEVPQAANPPAVA